MISYIGVFLLGLSTGLFISIGIIASLGFRAFPKILRDRWIADILKDRGNK